MLECHSRPFRSTSAIPNERHASATSTSLVLEEAADRPHGEMNSFGGTAGARFLTGSSHAPHPHLMPQGASSAAVDLSATRQRHVHSPAPSASDQLRTIPRPISH